MTAGDGPPEAPDTPSPGCYRLQEQVGFFLRRANQRHLAIFAAHIADLTPPQFAVLVTLRDVGEISQNQLGGLVGMDAATVKGVIDRLQARGLVMVGRHDGDRRRRLVSLSGDGRKTVDRRIPSAFAITAETLAPLTAREAGTLVRLLARIA